MMLISFHGVRGSHSTPGAETVKYGGNTSCVSISKKIDGIIKRIIIDSGDGIIKLGKTIVSNYFNKKEGYVVK